MRDSFAYGDHLSLFTLGVTPTTFLWSFTGRLLTVQSLLCRSSTCNRQLDLGVFRFLDCPPTPRCLSVLTDFTYRL